MTFPINPRATDMHEYDVWTRFSKFCDEQEQDIRDNTADAFDIGPHDMREDER